MPYRYIHLVTMCLLLLGARLGAQGYDTKFKSVGYKPGDIYHSDEGVHVSLNGGGLEVRLPLGPALPGGIGLRPTIQYHGKFVQGLNDHWYHEAYGEATGDLSDTLGLANSWRRWNPPTLPSAALHPGKLILCTAAGGFTASNANAPTLSITTPQGNHTAFFGIGPGMWRYMGNNEADRTEVRGLLAQFASDWHDYATTWGSADKGSSGFRGSDGSIFIFGPYDHQIVGMWDSFTDLNGQPRDVYTLIPTEMLQIQGDIITLWRQSRNTYTADRDERGVARGMWWAGSVYHPAWIKSRSGFKVNVEIYRDAPQDFTNAPRNAAIPMVERGLLRGWKVSYNGSGSGEVSYTVDASAAIPITFVGMDSTSGTTGLSLSGETPAQLRNSYGFLPGTADGWGSLGFQRYYDAEYTSDELAASFSSITHGPLTTTFEWNGPSGLLSKMITPSGKSYLFSFDMVQGVGVKSPSGNAVGNWNYNAITPLAKDYWSVVTKMEIQDGVAPQSRVTTYQWAIPQPVVNAGTTLPGGWTWQSTQHGVAQTLPDGQTTLHVFAKPVNPGGADLPSRAQTFMAMRQSLVGRYVFKAGDTSWQTFFTGSDPGSASWYKRDLFEGWDFRSWEDRLTAIYTNTEPRATRSITEVRNGPVAVTENDAWSKAVNQYAVKRVYTLAANTTPATKTWAPGLFTGLGTYIDSPGLGEAVAAGATSDTVTLTTFAAPREGLYARIESIQSKVLMAPVSGSTGLLPKEAFTYDATGGRAHLQTVKRIESPDGTSYLDTGLTYAPVGLYGSGRLSTVTLTGTAPNQESSADSLSGAVGAKYSYDPTGRWMTTIQLANGAGVYFPFSEQEPTHDGQGRPLSQTDVNGFTSSFTWDSLGRITSAAPASPEVGTTIIHADSLRKVTLNRGSQHNVYHFNGFGELIAEERTNDAGTTSHRLLGYGTSGQKNWETVWRPLGPTLNSWVGAMPGVGSTFSYDSKGRLIQTSNPNGEVTQTIYDDATPLVTKQVVAPGTTKAATTTFTRDVMGRLSQVTTSPDGSVQYNTTYAYDPAGRLLKVVQANPDSGQTQQRNWEYDGLGRLVALVQPESGRTEYTAFTVTGKPTRAIYGAGTTKSKTVTTRFDRLSRPFSVSSSDASVAQAYFYDEPGYGASNGRLTRSVDGDTTQAMVFGGLNGRLSNLSTTTAGQGFLQTYDYDTAGRRTLATIDGRKVNHTFYDATNAVNNASYTGNDGVKKDVVALTYDSTSWMPRNLTFGNGASTLLQYRPDQMGLESMAHYAAGGGSPQMQWSYLYDPAGNLKTDGEDTFDYDLLGRLKTATLKRFSGTSVTQVFTYDAFGNRLSSTVTGDVPTNIFNVGFLANTVELNQRNQLPVQTSTGVLTGAQYDEQGNLRFIWTKPGDPSKQLGMQYDALGRLIQMSDEARTVVERYFYSADGLRFRIEEYMGGMLQKTRYNIYNDLRQLVSKYRK